MANPVFRFVVMVVWALACVGVAIAGVFAIRSGGVLPGVLCLVVALALPIFPFHDLLQFLRSKS
jgi:hypothetical protein